MKKREKERGPRVLPEVALSAEGLKSSLYSCVMFDSVYVDFLSTTVFIIYWQWMLVNVKTLSQKLFDQDELYHFHSVVSCCGFHGNE